MEPPHKLPHRHPQMAPDQIQELDAWLAKTDHAYAAEAVDQSTQLWKAGWLDDLESIVAGAWRFVIPLFAGNIIGRCCCSLDKVWGVLTHEPWALTSWFDVFFDVGSVFTVYHVLFGLPIILIWGRKCFTMPRTGNGLWAYWIMIYTSIFIFLMGHNYELLDYLPMILLLASLGYLGRLLHLAHQGSTKVLPGVELIHKALVALYEPKYEEPAASSPS